MKGKVVMEYEERRELLKHIKWVDEIIDNTPWIIDEDFIKKHNIDVVAGSDDVYTKDGLNTYNNAKNMEKFMEIQRTPGLLIFYRYLQLFIHYNFKVYQQRLF